MNEKYMVRIIKTELDNFKNVNHGEIKYMNYQTVEKDARIEGRDVVGIYGQNGSGKTAMIEALDILRQVLSGKDISFSAYEGMMSIAQSSKITTYFYIEHKEQQYKVKYELELRKNIADKKIELSSEKLSFWIKGVSWKSKRSVYFQNPFYNPDSILENNPVQILTEPANYHKNISFLSSIQNLAIYCAQNDSSIFFNRLINKTISNTAPDRDEKNDEFDFAEVITGLFDFGRLYFQVVKVNQLGAINNNIMIPVNIHCELDNAIMQGCLPMFMNGHGEVSEEVYHQLEHAVASINIALKAIIPNLSIELKQVSEELNQDNVKLMQVEVYSNRNGKKFLTKYESEGIKRIISLLNYLIAMFNHPEICLAVDELDSGIFEYLLGELLGGSFGGSERADDLYLSQLESIRKA